MFGITIIKFKMKKREFIQENRSAGQLDSTEQSVKARLLFGSTPHNGVLFNKPNSRALLYKYAIITRRMVTGAGVRCQTVGNDASCNST
jgi:hypothetical protein